MNIMIDAMRFLYLCVLFFFSNWASLVATTDLSDSIKILTIIPARSGSKGIPHKNIRLLWGKPLIAWSIDQAKQSKYAEKMRVIVSTDSQEYAQIARGYGAETPFLRPEEISGDMAPDFLWAEHALQWLAENEGYIPDIVLQLRPTQPCRKVKDIDKCLDLFIGNRDTYDSLRTVIRSDLFEGKMYNIADGVLIPIFKIFDGIWEPHNGLRQYFPENIVDYFTDTQKQSVRYLHNGYIDIFNSSVVKKGSISGEVIFPYVMDVMDTIDIDTEEDWQEAELVGQAQ